MANTKITDLAALTPASGDEIPVNRAGSDGKLTVGANWVFDDLKGAVDASGNEQLLFDQVAGAVNYLTLANSATGVAPSFTASGDDTNVGISLIVKGVKDIVADIGGSASATSAFEVSGSGTSSFGGSNLGPVIRLKYNKTGAVGDNMQWVFQAKNDVGTSTNGVFIDYFTETSAAAASFTSRLQYRVRRSGSLLTEMHIGSGLSLGSTAAAPGQGNLAVGTGKGIFDDSANEQLLFSKTASAVNYLNITNSATGVHPAINAAGDDADIGLIFTAKGSPATGVTYNLGAADFPFAQYIGTSAGTGGPLFRILHNSASPAANDELGELIFAGNDSLSNTKSFATIDGFQLDPTNASEDGSLNLWTRVAGSGAYRMRVGDGVIVGSGTTYPGAGNLTFATGKGIFDESANEQLLFTTTASAVNYLNITNSATGNAPTISAAGGDANVALKFASKGNMGGAAAFTFDCGTSSFPDGLRLTTSDAGGGGPGMKFNVDGSSAAGTVCGFIVANGDNSGGAEVRYADIWFQILDGTAGSQDGEILFKTRINSAGADRLKIGDGVIVGSGSTYPGDGNLTASGSLKSSGTAGIGYGTGAGGTVTQITNKATGVTLNKITGQITMEGTAVLNANTTVSFTLTNSTIAATDLLVLNHISGGTAGSYLLNAQAAGGSATINVRNITAGNLTEAPVIAFAVIKAVTA